MCERCLGAGSLDPTASMALRLEWKLDHAFPGSQEQETWAEPDSYILKL